MGYIPLAETLGIFKTAFDIAKGLKDIDDATRRNAAVIELQEKILAAQSAQAALIEIVPKLEDEVAGFETWYAEKQRYELKEFGRGAFAYALKVDAQRGEPAHLICPTCYENHRKSLLQIEPGNHARTALGIVPARSCPVCKTKVAT
jgi:hypothetical protein